MKRIFDFILNRPIVQMVIATTLILGLFMITKSFSIPPLGNELSLKFLSNDMSIAYIADLSDVTCRHYFLDKAEATEELVSELYKVQEIDRVQVMSSKHEVIVFLNSNANWTIVGPKVNIIIKDFYENLLGDNSKHGTKFRGILSGY